MKLTVVRKIILGFAIISAMLLISNVVSYLGLSAISSSADSVVQQKMPVQAKMLQVQTGLLSLAKEATQGYYLSDIVSLTENQQKFADLALNVKQQLDAVGKTLTANKQIFEQAQQNTEAYLQHADNMYKQRTQQLQLAQQINQLTTSTLAKADEASALLQDLSYMESDTPSFARLTGTATNIDNKLLTLITGLKAFVTILEPSKNKEDQENMEFGISNTDVDVEYFNRLAQGINTDGLVASFNAQYQPFIAAFNGASGIFSLQQQRIAAIESAKAQNEAADLNFAQAISAVATLFKEINQDTLAGQNDILAAVQANIWQGLAILLIALALVFTVGTWVTRSIAVPLSRINRSLLVLASGDLTHKAKVVGDDEFATLAAAVNQLSASLHGVVEQIHQKELVLSQASVASVELGHKTLQHVASQRKQITETAHNTEEVRATSLSNLQQISHSTEQMQQAAGQGLKVAELVAKTKQQVLSQAQQSSSSSAIISRLDDNSKNIVSILHVIKSIADQTNLLALNAAIEAARAGEQGRGFAVVADEVRNLATKTQASTAEIESVITTLQSDAQQAVQAMALGSELSVESVALIEKVTEDVGNITQVIGRLSAINQKIAKDTQVQDGLLNTTANSLQSIVEVTELSAASTNEANQSIEQINVLAAELRSVVDRFKL